MHRNLSVIAAVFLVAGCASSTAEFDGEKVTVRSEGSALLYSLNGLKARTETYAKELCTKQFGANSVLGSEEKKITASKSMGSIAELRLKPWLGLFRPATHLRGDETMALFSRYPTHDQKIARTFLGNANIITACLRHSMAVTFQQS